MWQDENFELVRMRILRLSKHGIRLNQNQSIQPQMLKDKGENNVGEQKKSCKTLGKVVS